MILDMMSEEQLSGFVALFENSFLPPLDSPKTEAELMALLEEAEDDVRNGRVYDWEEVKKELRENLGYDG